MTDAIQRERNSGSPSGAQADTGPLPAIGAMIGILIISPIRSVVGRLQSNCVAHQESSERLLTSNHRLFSKRPLVVAPCSDCIDQNPNYQNDHRVANLT